MVLLLAQSQTIGGRIRFIGTLGASYSRRRTEILPQCGNAQLASRFIVEAREGVPLVLAVDLRRQARVCARLADECEDKHLAERLKAMARDLIAKATISKIS